MRVLWFCNCPVSDSNAGGTGTWLGAMARGLLNSDAVELGIIARGPVRLFTRRDYRQVKQWLVPVGARLGRGGLPATSLVQAIVAAVKEFSPDLVHTWGTESFWGLLPARGLLTYPSLLEMQGLKKAIGDVFYGGLSLVQTLRCIGPKELIKRHTLYHQRREFRLWETQECQIIRGHQMITVQSPWMAGQVRAINPTARLFKTDLALRKEFEASPEWQPQGRKVVFSISAYPSPFKGLHVAIRAIDVLNNRYPGVRLRVAGPFQREGLRQEGYVRWINSIVREAGLQDRVEWLGSLPGPDVVREMLSADALLVPTFIESYCVAMAEGMLIGTPIVASFTGGTAYLGRDEETCLFFPPGDAVMCAYQLERALSDQKLAMRLSRRGRAVAATRHNLNQIVQRQVQIYREALEPAS